MQMNKLIELSQRNRDSNMKQLLFFFWPHGAACVILVLSLWIEAGPGQRKCRVLATEPPGNF